MLTAASGLEKKTFFFPLNVCILSKCAPADSPVLLSDILYLQQGLWWAVASTLEHSSTWGRYISYRVFSNMQQELSAAFNIHSLTRLILDWLKAAALRLSMVFHGKHMLGIHPLWGFLGIKPSPHVLVWKSFQLHWRIQESLMLERQKEGDECKFHKASWHRTKCWLRSWIEALVSLGLWVRIPPLPPY